MFRKYNNDFHLSKLCLCCQILLSKSSPKQIFTKQLETNVSNLYNCFLHPTFPIYVVHAQPYILLITTASPIGQVNNKTLKLHVKPYTDVCTYHKFSPLNVRIAFKLWLMTLPSNVGFCKDVNEISASMMGPSVMKVRQDGPCCAGCDG